MTPNGLELSRPTALGSPSPTLRQHHWAFESPFSPAVRVGSIELLGGTRLNMTRDQLGVAERDVGVGLGEDDQHASTRPMEAVLALNGDVLARL